MKNHKLNFVIIDDKLVEIEIFEQALLRIENCQLIFKAQSEAQLMEYLNPHYSEVDYLIVDLKLGNNLKAGFRIIDSVSKAYQKIKILIYSEFIDTSYLQKIIFKETTRGFLEKGNDRFAFDLERAIKRIEEGGLFWEIALQKNLTINGKNYDIQVEKRLKEEKYYTLSKQDRLNKKISDMVTKKEEVKNYRYQYSYQEEYDISAQKWLIFKKVALGYSTEEIANSLDTKKSTINTQKNKIREQLEIEGQGDVWFLIKALEFGLEDITQFLEKKVKMSILKH